MSFLDFTWQQSRVVYFISYRIVVKKTADETDRKQSETRCMKILIHKVCRQKSWSEDGHRSDMVMVHPAIKSAPRSDLIPRLQATVQQATVHIASSCPARQTGIICRRSWSLLHWHCSSSVTDSKLYCFLVAMHEHCHHDFVIGLSGHKSMSGFLRYLKLWNYELLGQIGP